MSNSSLVSFTQQSPNNSGLRNHVIDTITIHCTAGQCSLEALGKIFAQPSRKASSNYGVDSAGRIGMYCLESFRSWCTSSASNDNRAVTIEVSSDSTAPYKCTDAALKGTIELCADICKRNGIKKLLWKADKSLIGKVDEQNMTVHRWFANKACPGDYIYERLGFIADNVNYLLGVSTASEVKQEATNTEFKIKVLGAVVNYRKGPGTNYDIVGQVKKGQVFTITETSEGKGASLWGKLKSGAGWISFDYCSKI